MGLRVVLRPETESDLLQAHDWYEQDGPELAEAFVGSFEATIDRIEAMPQLYAVAFKNIRRSKLRRFPYLVYYRVLSDRIEVIGVLHGSRDPRVLQERAGRQESS
jgi:plasmid stabilization system protein ParE